MIDEQSSASEHDYASYRSAIGAGSLPHEEACYLVRIPVHIALLKKGYYCQTPFLEYMSALILVWLLSSSPSAVLVAGQNLLCMCYSHLGTYGYSWLPQMRRALCLSKVLEASSGANYHG